MLGCPTGCVAKSMWGACFLAMSLVSCGGGQSQVSFVSNERPSGYAAAQGSLSSPPPNPNGEVDLDDDDLVEPEHPAADSKQERALVHVHGPKEKEVCSGVLLGPKIVATAQRCLRGYPKGVTLLGADNEIRVEVASSTLTWTNRRVKYSVLPKCEEADLDVAILVLEEAAPSLVVPLKVISAPDTGANVQALGFGRCKGVSSAMKERTGVVRSRVAQAIVIDIPLCKGDIGGPVIDGRDGDVIGLISRRDDPEGSPLKTTTIARLDTVWARDLMTQGKSLGDNVESAKSQVVSCR